MSVEKLQQMTDIIKTMQGLRNGIVNEETKIEKSRLQYEAVVQIQNYLEGIAEATKDFSWSIEKMPINLYWLNMQKDTADPRTQHHCLSIRFNKGYVTFQEPSFASELRWDNFCHLSKDKIYKYKSDSEIEGDFIRLINNWSKIKALVEVGAEDAMMKIMADIEKESRNFSKSYEAAMSFQI